MSSLGFGDWKEIEEDSREKYQLYLCSREWAEKKQAVLERSEGKCERCIHGMMEEVHHKTYQNKYNERLEDLQGLCFDCHRFVHAKSNFDPQKILPTFAPEELLDKQAPFSIHCGFTGLQELTGGLCTKTLTVIGCPPGHGKTSFLCKMARAASLQAAAHFFTLESSLGALVARIRTQTAEEDDPVEKLYLTICDQVPVTISHIERICKFKKAEKFLYALFIDGLELISPEENEARPWHLRTALVRLKELSMALEIPVVCTVNTKPTHDREDNRPRISDFKEQIGVAEIADTVILLYRPDKYDPEDRPGEAHALVAKNRNGPIGHTRLTWHNDRRDFTDFIPLEEEESGWINSGL